jgi:hypothetical protein
LKLKLFVKELTQTHWLGHVEEHGQFYRIKKEAEQDAKMGSLWIAILENGGMMLLSVSSLINNNMRLSSMFSLKYVFSVYSYTDKLFSSYAIS